MLAQATHPVTTQDTECAELQITPLRIAGVCALGSVGAALTGVYRLGKGKGALAAFATSVGLWFVGSRLVVSAANAFQACRGQPPLLPVLPRESMVATRPMTEHLAP